MNKESFKSFIEKIVENEMDETQKTQFQIEGNEYIDNLFESPESKSFDEDYDFKLDYGISPDGLKLIELGIGILPIIVSCFTLYLQYKKTDAEKLKTKLDKFELQRVFFEKMKQENVPDEFAVKLSAKYHTELAKIIEEL
jgi:hypothetical protein